MDRTGIEWTDATWNPVSGCDKVSPGCDRCYAESIATRFAGTPAYPNGFAVTLHPERLDVPLPWTRPRLVFVNSMSDLFHDEIPDEYVADVFAVMSMAKQHIFQVLTKRHGRMRSLLGSPTFKLLVNTARLRRGVPVLPDSRRPDGTYAWPLPNVWMVVSVEDQKRAALRIPALLETPAAVRGLSCEPLLGRLDLTPWLGGLSYPNTTMGRGGIGGQVMTNGPGIDWVIVGGESGKGSRPMFTGWPLSILAQCEGFGVPLMFKQWGDWAPGGANAVMVGEDGTFCPTRGKVLCTIQDWGHSHTLMSRVGKKAAGRELDGRLHDGYPAVAASIIEARRQRASAH